RRPAPRKPPAPRRRRPAPGAHAAAFAAPQQVGPGLGGLPVALGDGSLLPSIRTPIITSTHAFASSSRTFRCTPSAHRADPQVLSIARRIVRYAVATTMRQEEICRPDWSDVDMKRRILIIRDRKDRAPQPRD